MSVKLGRPVTLIASAVCIALASATTGYLYGKHESAGDATAEFYAAAASNVRITSRALSSMRSDADREALRFLESILNIELVTLNTYERDVPLHLRDPVVYSSVQTAREYFSRYPEAAPSKHAAEALQLQQKSGIAP
jgi:hypothetical protein